MNLGRGGREGKEGCREGGRGERKGEKGRVGRRERGGREPEREKESMSACKQTVFRVEGGLAWNHSPLGRAGFIHAAKKMPVTARMGQAMVMKMP